MYIYKVGQYYNLQNIVVHYFLPDGIYYISSSSNPVSVVDDSNLHRYKFDSQSLNLPVVASDPFLATCDISAILVGLLNIVTDDASANSSIDIGTITKQFVKGYYKDVLLNL